MGRPRLKPHGQASNLTFLLESLKMSSAVMWPLSTQKFKEASADAVKTALV